MRKADHLTGKKSWSVRNWGSSWKGNIMSWQTGETNGAGWRTGCLSLRDRKDVIRQDKIKWKNVPYYLPTMTAGKKSLRTSRWLPGEWIHWKEKKRIKKLHWNTFLIYARACLWKGGKLWIKRVNRRTFSIFQREVDYPSLFSFLPREICFQLT